MKDFCNSFIYPDKYIQLNQRFQADELYNRFRDKILFRIKVSSGNPYGIKPPNGLLVYGPQSNGKSILVKQFAQSTNLPYIIVNRYDILGDGGNHTSGGFNKLMKTAEKLAPCIVIIENIETLIPNRKKLSDSDEYVDVMSNLSLIKDCGEKGVFVFATTSKPRDLDPQIGMSGYLNELFYTPYPDKERRKQVVKKLMETIPCEKDINYDTIVDESVDFTIGDLASLVDDIAVNAAIHNSTVCNEHIQTALENLRRPMTSFGKKEYDEIHSLLEAKNRRKLTRTIGFR